MNDCTLPACFLTQTATPHVLGAWPVPSARRLKQERGWGPALVSCALLFTGLNLTF